MKVKRLALLSNLQMENQGGNVIKIKRWHGSKERKYQLGTVAAGRGTLPKLLPLWAGKDILWDAIQLGLPLADPSKGL